MATATDLAHVLDQVRDHVEERLDDGDITGGREVRSAMLELLAELGPLTALEIACLPDESIDQLNEKAERLLDLFEVAA